MQADSQIQQTQKQKGKQIVDMKKANQADGQLEGREAKPGIVRLHLHCTVSVKPQAEVSVGPMTCDQFHPII